MGQKTHPIGFRLGFITNWHSSWYDDKSFTTKLQEDSMIRTYVKKRFENAGIAKIEVERTPKKITLTIHTSRPGQVIGKSGKEINLLEAELKKISGELGLDWKKALHGSVENAYQAEYDFSEAEIDAWPEIVFKPAPRWLEEKRKARA